ncbi:MAG: DoxX family protein [Gemmatimonadaceae bacterium]
MQKTWVSLAPIPLRIMMAIGFLYHGLPKLLDAGERQGFTGMLQGIGVPMPGIMAWVVAIVEVFGAIALLIGAFVLVAAALLTIHMLVALFTVHIGAGFSFMNITGMNETGMTFGMPGYEVNLLYIAALVSLMLSGAGAYSVDGRRTTGVRTREGTETRSDVA